MVEPTRAVLQHLESLRRAGVREWRRIAAAATTAPCLAAEAASGENSPVPNAVHSSVPGTSSVLFAETEIAQPGTAAGCRAFQPLDLSLEERKLRLDELKARVAACVRCQELASTRTQTVFGVGSPQARLLFIGEAPGADEDAQGEPFVGRAGQLLNDIIRACRMKREDVYICNVLRCRPPGNRLPSPQEAANCREYLDGQIAIVNPEYIVCWGSCAAKSLLGSEDSIGKMRGKFYQYGRAKVLCTYHPSYLLRNPAAKKDVWEDMKSLFRDMGIDLTAK
jgi:DNA polymerase